MDRPTTFLDEDFFTDSVIRHEPHFLFPPIERDFPFTLLATFLQFYPYGHNTLGQPVLEPAHKDSVVRQQLLFSKKQTELIRFLHGYKTSISGLEMLIPQLIRLLVSEEQSRNMAQVRGATAELTHLIPDWSRVSSTLDQAHVLKMFSHIPTDESIIGSFVHELDALFSMVVQGVRTWEEISQRIPYSTQATDALVRLYTEILSSFASCLLPHTPEKRKRMLQEIASRYYQMRVLTPLFPDELLLLRSESESHYEQLREQLVSAWTSNSIVAHESEAMMRRKATTWHEVRGVLNVKSDLFDNFFQLTFGWDDISLVGDRLVVGELKDRMYGLVGLEGEILYIQLLLYGYIAQNLLHQRKYHSHKWFAKNNGNVVLTINNFPVFDIPVTVMFRQLDRENGTFITRQIRMDRRLSQQASNLLQWLVASCEAFIEDPVVRRWKVEHTQKPRRRKQ